MGYNERIDKILSSCGIMSRSQARRAAREGRISLDGVIVRTTDIRVTENNLLELDVKTDNNKRKQTQMMNKPQGYVCSTDEPGSHTVLELLEPPYSSIKLFPAGRLDKDTTGFVLLTNDGDAAHSLLSPIRDVEKTYTFTAQPPLTEETAEILRNGVELADGTVTKKCAITLNENGGIITITEGKYHQIKRMVATVGSRITSLHRSGFGVLRLDPQLRPGDYRSLTEQEKTMLLGSIGRTE